MMLRPIFPAALLIISCIAQGADLTIEVTGIQNNKGHVFLAIDSNSENFANSKAAIAGIKLKANPDRSKVTLYDLPNGRYAISVIHDENDNERLDMKGQTPIEGYGFSGVGGAYKQPSFQKAAVEISGSNNNVTIKAIYLD